MLLLLFGDGVVDDVIVVATAVVDVSAAAALPLQHFPSSLDTKTISVFSIFLSFHLDKITILEM